MVNTEENHSDNGSKSCNHHSPKHLSTLSPSLFIIKKKKKTNKQSNCSRKTWSITAAEEEKKKKKKLENRRRQDGVINIFSLLVPVLYFGDCGPTLRHNHIHVQKKASNDTFASMFR